MGNTIKTFYGNLSKSGRIIFWTVLQLLVVVVLVLIVVSVFREKERVEIKGADDALSEVPEKYVEEFKNTLWELVSSNVDGLDKSVIDDVVIRDDSYEEIIDEDAKSVNFIIDIDSIKQTFMVSIGWSSNMKDGPDNNISIECPPIEKMKYPETICYGMYNNTYSLDLYLPHSVGSADAAPDYIISGDESTKTLDIMLSTCDVEKFKKEAWDYLSTVPIDFSDYTVNYETYSMDVECR